MLRAANTIAAISTAGGVGGIGIVRLSGPEALAIAKTICSGQIVPREAGFHNFYNADQEIVDQGVILFFPNPKSFTGEDVIEFQGHGGQTVLNAVLNLCIDKGARLAEPGEFTRRAYLNNKMDLAQAESVIDVINATTIEAVKSAAQSLSGKFSIKINGLLKKLIELRVFVEACLDFPEEEIDFIEQGNVIDRLNNIAAEVDQILLVARHGQLLKEGANVVLIGQPNVGKSSLLNQLVGEEKAIVTDVPGTTRDPIASNISIHGIPLNVFDTAGLRATDDQVELLGISKTWESIKGSHIAMVLVDATKGAGNYEKDIISRLPKNIEILWIYNKIDLTDDKPKAVEHNQNKSIYISAKLDLGIDLLREALYEILTGGSAYNNNETIYTARSRHIDALNAVKASIIMGLAQKDSSELLAEELMLAQNALSSITGEFSSDDLLGKIFSEFCIGK